MVLIKRKKMYWIILGVRPNIIRLVKKSENASHKAREINYMQKTTM